MKQISDNKIVIFTIGHGNRKIEYLIGLLQQNNIGIVIDVRSLPYSRFHPQFKQVNFMNSLISAGITYLWLGKELGGRPADPNLYRNGKADYQAIKVTKLFTDGIQQVLKLAGGNIKVTLICSERDQNECHRKHLIAVELAKLGVIVLHINKVGTIDQHVNIDDYGLFN
jgi:uncharacterized protein (DUF488 family)